MEKSEYKELLSNSISETSHYRDLLEKVFKTVEREPNDMELGKSIRQLYWESNED